METTTSSYTPSPTDICSPSSAVSLGSLFERSVLISDENLHSPAVRDALLELFFETFQVSSLLLCKRAALSAFGCGRTTALIFDSGASCTTAAAVVDGLVIQRSIRLSPIAGNWLDHLIMSVSTSQHNELLPCYTLKTTTTSSTIPTTTTTDNNTTSQTTLPRAVVMKESTSSALVDGGYYRWSRQHLAACVKCTQLSCDKHSCDKLPPTAGHAVGQPVGSDKREGSYLLPDGTLIDTSVLYDEQDSGCDRIFPGVLFEPYSDKSHLFISSLSTNLSNLIQQEQQIHPLSFMSFGNTTCDLISPLQSFPGFPDLLRSSLVAASADISCPPSSASSAATNSSASTLSLPVVSELCQSVIVTGGTTLLPSFLPSLKSNLAKRGTFSRPSHTDGGHNSFRILSSLSPRERQFTSWIGGSILASLGSFSSHAITRQEYKETGKHIVDRKCP
eukprot:GHVS01003109.1.p1 GENE.GHVS01003109.1~~GHVS01003109.1.p1  ORF type:complete len:462 (-),score=52.93 GHVS01003109.1:83-1423(-)